MKCKTCVVPHRVAELRFDNGLVVINAYMPTSRDLTKREEVFSTIGTRLCSIRESVPLIVLGDLNAEPEARRGMGQPQTAAFLQLEDFMCSNTFLLDFG